MSNDKQKLITLKDVKKYYGSGDYRFLALTDINLTIDSGEFLVILGPSGSGKSTLLNLLGGMDVISEGQMLFGEIDLAKASDHQLTLYRRHEIGFVFQFYNLVPSLTALENVEVSAELASDSIAPQKALAMVGLQDVMDHFPAQLSGGQQQRVSIARAIAGKPSILLCDEPTGALDSNSSQNVINILKDIHINLGKTIIMVTHEKSLAQNADRIIQVMDGKITTDTSSQEFFANA